MRLQGVKRVFDLGLALLAAIVLSPLILILGTMVRVRLGSPVLFKQWRPGLHGLPFLMIKFRTMTDARDETGNLLPDAARLTRFGKLLRSSSLDELPELLNVLRGEMRLVGPRPLPKEFAFRFQGVSSHHGLVAWNRNEPLHRVQIEKKQP